MNATVICTQYHYYQSAKCVRVETVIPATKQPTEPWPLRPRTEKRTSTTEECTVRSRAALAKQLVINCLLRHFDNSESRRTIPQFFHESWRRYKKGEILQIHLPRWLHTSVILFHIIMCYNSGAYLVNEKLKSRELNMSVVSLTSYYQLAKKKRASAATCFWLRCWIINSFTGTTGRQL